jgi:Fe-S oxidoreductase
MVTTDTVPSPTLSEAFFKSLFEEAGGEKVLTCLQCGTCNAACPFGMWMDFPPRKIISAARMNEFDEVLESDSVWMCVSCYACAEDCPSIIPLTSILMTRAKEELVLAGSVPAELQSALESSQRYGNPLGESSRKRAAWTAGIDPPVTILPKEKRPVDVLWFVGDYASYHPRVQQSTRALAKILNALGVDYGILGPEEVSDGDSQRLAGENGLFEMLAFKNWRAFSKYEFNTIITTDPHAFNAIKNEYPRLEISYPVLHYTEYLAERMDQLEPLLKNEVNVVVAYHDPCYLGRVNHVYFEPRALLEAIPGVALVEMAHNRGNSLCCGGGGGGMWLDGFLWEKTSSRPSEWRVKEAVNAWPEERFFSCIQPTSKRKKKKEDRVYPSTRVLAVACPYEAPRFEDAVKVVPEASDLLVRDIAELLAESMGL